MPANPLVNNNNNIINNVITSKFIGVDLGRKTLFAAASQTKQWSWSNKTWQFESGSTKAKRKLQRWKAKEGIDLIEQNIPSHCTTNGELLLDWFNYTVRHLDTLCEFYHQTKCRRLKFTQYRKHQIAYAKMAKSVGGSPRSGNIIALGNPTFSGSTHGYAPTPTVSAVKALQRYHKVLLVDEYMTSQCCSKCFNKLDKVKHTILITDRQTKLQTLRRVNNFRVLYCPTCKIFWNRDNNSAHNMRTLAIQREMYRTRPAQFSRPTK